MEEDVTRGLTGEVSEVIGVKRTYISPMTADTPMKTWGSKADDQKTKLARTCMWAPVLTSLTTYSVPQACARVECTEVTVHQRLGDSTDRHFNTTGRRFYSAVDEKSDVRHITGSSTEKKIKATEVRELICAQLDSLSRWYEAVRLLVTSWETGKETVMMYLGMCIWGGGESESAAMKVVGKRDGMAKRIAKRGGRNKVGIERRDGRERGRNRDLRKSEDIDELRQRAASFHGLNVKKSEKGRTVELLWRSEVSRGSRVSEANGVREGYRVSDGNGSSERTGARRDVMSRSRNGSSDESDYGDEDEKSEEESDERSLDGVEVLSKPTWRDSTFQRINQFKLIHYDNKDLFPKFYKLKNCLLEYQSKRDGKLHCIILVEQRVSTHVISHFINSDQDLNKKGLKSAHLYTTKSSATPHLKIAKQEAKKAIEAFRLKEVSVLVATNVVEEGVDVPAANCVIRFDAMLTSVSLTQGRGRAREPKSDFVVMDERPDRSVARLMRAEQRQHEMLEMEMEERQSGVNDEVNDWMTQRSHDSGVEGSKSKGLKSALKKTRDSSNESYPSHQTALSREKEEFRFNVMRVLRGDGVGEDPVCGVNSITQIVNGPTAMRGTERCGVTEVCVRECGVCWQKATCTCTPPAAFKNVMTFRWRSPEGTASEASEVSIVGEGRGDSKKAAKRAAASEVLKRLQEWAQSTRGVDGRR
eukprot:GHVN01085701.1.p1 GENE.GHVN01085701.1~~GHVN01085701.1.p1  ORF type:complete len:701 (-),score=185.94 GHVN01085701.1:406-2508(-)